MREQDLRALGDPEIRSGHPGLYQLVHFRQECSHVHCDSRSEDVHHPGIEDTGGQEMQGELAKIVDDRVTGIVAALVAHDEVGLVGEVISDLSLSFVSPVRTDYCDDRHAFLLEALILYDRIRRGKPRQRSPPGLRLPGMVCAAFCSQQENEKAPAFAGARFMLDKRRATCPWPFS